MPVAATQTEPMWDVIDKLNMEFDEVQVKNNKLEEELRGFHLEKHKKNNETVGQLHKLFWDCRECMAEQWEDEYQLWGEYPVYNYLREYIYGDEEAELDDDLDEYFGRGRHAPNTQTAESRIDEMLNQTLTMVDEMEAMRQRMEVQMNAWNNRRRV